MVKAAEGGRSLRRPQVAFSLSRRGFHVLLLGILLVGGVTLSGFLGWGRSRPGLNNQQRERGASAFTLQSPVFPSGGTIPRKFTCDGADLSPPLRWTEPPAATQSFALIVDDPDAPMGIWVHWVVYNLPGSLRELLEGVPNKEQVAGGGFQGVNDFLTVGYGGPCPPPGKAHRYFFKLYALDAKLNLKPRAAKREVEEAMKGHILAQTQLMGQYGR